MWLGTAALVLFAIQFLKETGNFNALTDVFKKKTTQQTTFCKGLFSEDKNTTFLRCIKLSARNNHF